jgi:thioredoxin reductase (NADPH)
MAANIEKINLNTKTIEIDDDKTVSAKAIIIATGSKPRPLNIPGEKEFAGKGISYCATCDGSFYEGKHVYVIGGGNSAVEEALFLTKFASKITMIHQFDSFQANKTSTEEALNHPKINVLWKHEPRGFLGEDSFEKLEVEDLITGQKKILDEGEGVFVFVGYIPQTDIFGETLKKDNWGSIVSDENMATNIPGVYVAGDVRSKKYRQITTAVNDGTIASLEAAEYIKTQRI